MAFTADELVSINNSSLEVYIDKGKVWKQNTANKPMLAAFNQYAGKFAGGNMYVSVGVKGVGHGGALEGFSGDDQVGYYNPVGPKRARYPWKEHHIGIVVTHTEMKIDGINVVEDGADQTTSQMDGAEEHRLAHLLDEKLDDLGEDYSYSLDLLLHGDGSADAKGLAGILSLLSTTPAVGTTGGISRVSNTYWRNRARTTANSNVITSSATAGGALITALDQDQRFLNQFARGDTRIRYFCGSSFIDAYKNEMRANGQYFMSPWGDKKPDGAMKDPSHAGRDLEWDPTMDALSLQKYCYAIDMGRNGIRLLYMDGQRMKKHNPARPYDRYVMYNGITMTGVLVAKQLNTSAIYEIA